MNHPVDRIADPWGERTPYDAMDVAVRDGRMVGVRGRAVDRVNRGRPGPKDLYGWQTNASPDRLTRPLIRENGRLVECDWDTAMNRITGRTRQLLDDEGPGSIGFYTSGQLFRLLDRLEGGDPPRLVCVDPRYTHVARRADVHLAPRAGTNLALLNALLHEIIRTDRIDAATWRRTPSASTSWPPWSAAARPRGRRASATCRPRRSSGPRRSSAAPSGCCPPSSRASTSPTRPPLPPSRSSTTCTSCAACWAGPAAGCCR